MPEEQTTQTTQTTEPQFAVPEAYQDKPWVEKIKSPDDLWKTLDNAQSALGRPRIPAPDAPDEDWDKFYANAGRPESPDKYAFSEVKGLPEGFDVKPFQEKAGSILHAAGLNNKQADKVFQLFIEAEMAAATANGQTMKAKQAELDKQYDEIVKATFGDKYGEAEKVALAAFDKFVPKELAGAKADIANNPKALAAMVAILSSQNAEIEKIKKEYGAEGSLTSGEQTTSKGIDETRKELAQLRASPIAKDFTHPEHKATVARIQALEGNVKAYYAKKP